MLPLKSLFNVSRDLPSHQWWGHVRFLTDLHQNLVTFGWDSEFMLRHILQGNQILNQVAACFDMRMPTQKWESLATQWLQAEARRDFSDFVKICKDICPEIIGENGDLTHIFDPGFRFSMGEAEIHELDYYGYASNLQSLSWMQKKLGDDLKAKLHVFPNGEDQVSFGLGVWTESKKPILSAIRDLPAPGAER